MTPNCDFVPLLQDHLRQCIDQIEELFISGSSSRMDHEETSVTSSPSKASTASSSSADSGLLLSSPEGQRPSPKKSAGNSNEEEKQRTPTEVFRVSALCVT